MAKRTIYGGPVLWGGVVLPDGPVDESNLFADLSDDDRKARLEALHRDLEAKGFYKDPAQRAVEQDALRAAPENVDQNEGTPDGMIVDTSTRIGQTEPAPPSSSRPVHEADADRERNEAYRKAAEEAERAVQSQSGGSKGRK